MEPLEAAVARMHGQRFAQGLRQIAGKRRELRTRGDIQRVAGVLELRVSEWVTTSSDNQLPVTVVNHGNRAVQVRVHFDSENPLRIAVDDSELFTVRPGDSRRPSELDIVAFVRRDDEQQARADLLALDALVPAGDDLAGADGEAVARAACDEQSTCRRRRAET